MVVTFPFLFRTDIVRPIEIKIVCLKQTNLTALHKGKLYTLRCYITRHNQKKTQRKVFFLFMYSVW